MRLTSATATSHPPTERELGLALRIRTPIDQTATRIVELAHHRITSWRTPMAIRSPRRDHEPRPGFPLPRGPLAVGLAIGAVLGMLLGAVVDPFLLWLTVGLCVGLLLGLVFEERDPRNDPRSDQQRPGSR